MEEASAGLREYRRAVAELGRLEKNPHFRRCGRCRRVSFMALLDGGTEDLRLAVRLCQEHAATGEDSGMPPCKFEGCVFHETLDFPLARRLLKINGGRLDGEDGKGRKTGTFPLSRQTEGRREGVGTVLLEFDRRKATAHVWPGLPEEEDPGFHPLEAAARRWDRHFAACRERDLDRYREARELARADLEIEPPRNWERRAPFRAARPGPR